MSPSLFRPRTAVCALSLCVLSACGGGGGKLSGDDAILASDPNANLAPRPTQIIVLQTSTEATPGIYTAALGTTGIETTEDLTLGYTTFQAEQIKIAVAYPKGHTEKYLLFAEVKGSTYLYQCISANWTAAEKTSLGNPATCGAGIFFDGITHQLTLTKASIPGPIISTLNGPVQTRVGLNVQTTLVPPTFP